MKTKDLVNVPFTERDITAEEAEPFFRVSKEPLQLEGLCFDRKGDLYFVEVFNGTVFKLTMKTNKLTKIAQLRGENPSALKIHKDGRLFLCCLGNFKDSGSIVAIDPKTKKKETIIPKSKGYVIDDMVFASDGSFYFSDFKGDSTNPIGGIYYVDKDYKTITPVITRLAIPNGLALTPDERGLWVTEMARNQLIFANLNKDRKSIPPYGTSIPYRFQGMNGPDSCSIDRDGNLYVAMYEQGRVLVFNSKGIVQKQVILPHSQEGHMLRSTHPMVAPDKKTLIICANDGQGDEGSWLYKAKALAKGYKSYQFD